MATLSNPFFFLWWATIGNAMLLEGMAIAGVLGALVFYFFHISSDFTWYSLVSFSLGKGRKMMSDSVYSAILMAVGTFLVLLGGYFLVEGGSRLVGCLTVYR